MQMLNRARPTEEEIHILRGIARAAANARQGGQGGA
jgi:tRNA C32,U32 (ribose-2'-O)-methylase TrmJ